MLNKWQVLLKRVLLQANKLGFEGILRIITTSRKPPRNIDNYKLGAFIGIRYTTYYVFLQNKGDQ